MVLKEVKRSLVNPAGRSVAVDADSFADGSRTETILLYVDSAERDREQA